MKNVRIEIVFYYLFFNLLVAFIAADHPSAFVRNPHSLGGEKMTIRNAPPPPVRPVGRSTDRWIGPGSETIIIIIIYVYVKCIRCKSRSVIPNATRYDR